MLFCSISSLFGDILLGLKNLNVFVVLTLIFIRKKILSFFLFSSSSDILIVYESWGSNLIQLKNRDKKNSILPPYSLGSWVSTGGCVVRNSRGAKKGKRMPKKCKRVIPGNLRSNLVAGNKHYEFFSFSFFFGGGIRRGGWVGTV